jgi:glycerol-3-phosphate acyltransferase PlsY
VNARLAAFAAAAFLCGSFPTAYFAGRLRGTDIRKHGSGNVGATNAFRVLGKGAGIAVFVVDFLKGFLPAFVYVRTAGDPATAVWIGFAGILGHVFTPFLGFKGGKGVATGAGVLTACYPRLFLGGMIAWTAVFAFSRVVSIASLTALAVVNALAFATSAAPRARAAFFLIFVLIAWTHRENIARLRLGTEKKIR